MDKIEKLRHFKQYFNRVADRITSGKCASRCYVIFEELLETIGFPKSKIREIYTDSGFYDWNDMFLAREENKYSIPVNNAMARIEGIKIAVNTVLNSQINTLIAIEDHDHA